MKFKEILLNATYLVDLAIAALWLLMAFGVLSFPVLASRSVVGVSIDVTWVELLFLGWTTLRGGADGLILRHFFNESSGDPLSSGITALMFIAVLGFTLVRIATFTLVLQPLIIAGILLGILSIVIGGILWYVFNRL